MNMLSTNIKKKVNSEKLDKIVELAKECIFQTGAVTKLDESQIRNLQNMAESTDSIKALENFIYYQMGRYKKEWKDSEFGDRVLAHFKELDRIAKSMTSDHKEEYPLRLYLRRLYLGFLARWFKAKKKGGTK